MFLKPHLHLLACLTVFLISACGGGGTTSVPPVPPVIIPESAPAQLQLVSTQPPMGAKLGLKETLSIVLSFDADETTVNSSNVRLFLNGIYDASSSGPAVPGKVSYDPSTKSISFAPTSLLEHERRYTLVMRGIKDKAGNEMAAVELIFDTYTNRRIKDVEFGGSTLWVRTVDENGNQRTAQYGDQGPDGQWLTADDVLASYYYTTVTKTASSEIIQTLSYINAGPDGIWFTSDDKVDRCFGTQIQLDKQGRYTQLAWFTGAEKDCINESAISSYTSYEYDDEGRLKLIVNYERIGSDGKWFTDDDTISQYAIHMENDGEYEKYLMRYASGEDAVWFTADDLIKDYTKTDRDPHTSSYSSTTFSAPGADHSWLTEDDLPSFHESAVFNADGVMLAYKHFILTSIGDDLLFGTADDGISQFMTTIDVDSDTHKFINFSGKGPDNLLFTADDVIVDYMVTKILSNDSQAQRSITTHYTNAGVDQVWFTPDDVGADVSAALLRLDDTSEATINYDGAGADGVWLTDDDLIQRYQVNQYADNGNKILFLHSNGAGADGLWFTEDDKFFQRTEYDPLN